MSKQTNAEHLQQAPLAETLTGVLESIKDFKKVTDEQILRKTFFAKLEDARMLKVKGIKRVVVLVGSAEESVAAISEGFTLALREYSWNKEDEGKTFRGFQFFTASAEKAEEIRRIIPTHAKIPKSDPTRVSICMMPKNVSLRWLARRFIRQNVPFP